jgi:hypothetical protein
VKSKDKNTFVLYENEESKGNISYNQKENFIMLHITKDIMYKHNNILETPYLCSKELSTKLKKQIVKATLKGNFQSY